MTYRELKAALRVLGLGERATVQEIKTRYRELAKQHHPDGGNGAKSEEIYRVIEANRVIMKYVESYSYCFSEREYLEQNPDERLRRQFMSDSVWSKR